MADLSKVYSEDGSEYNLNDSDAESKITDLQNNKVDKVSGKGLSTNDYTTTEKNKLSGISTNANKVEKSSTNGKIKIDGTETTVYDDTNVTDQLDLCLYIDSDGYICLKEE